MGLAQWLQIQFLQFTQQKRDFTLSELLSLPNTCRLVILPEHNFSLRQMKNKNQMETSKFLGKRTETITFNHEYLVNSLNSDMTWKTNPPVTSTMYKNLVSLNIQYLGSTQDR